MKFESTERAQPEKKEFSQEEIERINVAKERLQALTDKAATTVGMALENKFIPELDGARLYKFLEKIAEEANDVDNPENGADEIVAHLEWLGERVKLPDDTRREKAEGLIKKLEEMGQEKAYQETTSDIDSQVQNRGQKKKGGFLRMR